MSSSTVARIVLVVLLLLEAAAGAWLIRDALGSLDHQVDTVRAIGFAVLVAVLALVILRQAEPPRARSGRGSGRHRDPHRPGDDGALLRHIVSTMDGRHGDASGTPAFALLAVGSQAIIWFCAWRAMPEPLGQALARSMAGAAVVLVGGIAALFVGGVVASFFMV
jgi:hypothetical protein